MRQIALLSLFLPLPAHADQPIPAAPPGPVEQVVLAHRLMAAGAATRDGLAQIAAAHLAAGVTLRPADLAPQVSGKGKPDPLPRPDAAALLATARQAVETDETLGILLTSSQMSAEILPKSTLRAQGGTLAPGQSHSFTLPADGGAALAIGLIATAPLGLAVAQDARLLCKTTDLCRLTLAESASLTVTLANPGEGPASYQLLLP